MAPAPLVPLPAITDKTPPRPPVVARDPTDKQPLLPDFDEPELKVRSPLEPAIPELILRTTRLPLLLAVPSPDASIRPPPLRDVLQLD